MFLTIFWSPYIIPEFIKAPHAVIGEEDSYSWFYSNPKTHNVESYKCLDRSTTDPGFQESLKFLRDHVECQVGARRLLS